MNRGLPGSLASSPLPAIPGSAAVRVLVALGFVCGYLALDWVSYIHPMQQYSITPWNPQPALAIALLMLGGQAWLPLVFLAALAAEWIVRGAPLASASTLLVAAVLTLGYAAIARAMRGPYAVDPALGSRADAVRLVGVSATGALLTGILYIAALLASGQGPLEDPFVALVRFWIGDAIGILVTLPLLLMLSVPARRAELHAALRRREALLHAGVIALALVIVFKASGADPVKYFYLLFLPLIFTASRFGMVGSTLAALVIQGAVIALGELAGVGTLTVFDFQALLIALTVTGLFLGVTVDERARAREELRLSLRMAAAGEMAAALAHELNQPLTAVTSYARSCELIAAAPEAPPGLLQATLGKLVAESTRAAEVVRRLRDFFRTGASRRASLDRGPLVGRVLEGARANADAQGVELRLPEAPAAVVLADILQLELVLKNLVVNAIEAAAQGGAPRQVEVHVERAGPSWTVSIVDTGSGVDAADAERIFEPFETGRATGMGMGLAISRAIVAAHGGRLWVEPGPRGVFRLSLPAAEQSHG